MSAPEITIKGQWAQRLIREKLKQTLRKLPSDIALPGAGDGHQGFLLPGAPQRSISWDDLPPDPFYDETSQDDTEAASFATAEAVPDFPARKVCIIGAGVAGLYIAMILENLQIPNLTYEILEASDRVGGRIYTHYFSKRPHDYYDIGAMRFPQIPFMERTFDLFKRTKVPLIKYYLDGGSQCPKLFNDTLFEPGVPDPYRVSKANGGHVPDKWISKDIAGDAFLPYKEALKDDFQKGWEKLMEADAFSTREYLKVGGPEGKEQKYDFFTVQWAETQNTSTNLFDQAFSESVMDSLDFDYPATEWVVDPETGEKKEVKKEVEWFCIEGGSSLLIDGMKKFLTQEVQTKKRVEAISIDRDSSSDNNMSVKCADEDSPREGYDTVFNTTALGCLGRIDLRSLDLDPSVKDAIRSLHYDDSVKVALKFSHPWWNTTCGIKQGGVSSTDLPLRTCVYPSYNINDGPTNEAVLLASYTWAQDATRIGSLIGTEEGEKELVDVLLKNLARMHQKGSTYEEIYKTIKQAYTGQYHVYSWSHDPYTSGAFALFGGGQFSELYPLLSLPAADGKFHMVGEASSVHHAWVVGSLDSAVAAVHKFLRRYYTVDIMNKLRSEWKDPEEIEPGIHGTVHLQIAFDEMQRVARNMET
ncbi:l-amino acid oxidase [Fusarium heterosporum]|uniref:L-amino acid oxidase n=1 Tax=Fusarium heterosporum TaxID=42747 RepID=A0A8H5T310_FUSHE|nr:l-amino acid oxidase [Fusarium heterosporum]